MKYGGSTGQKRGGLFVLLAFLLSLLPIATQATMAAVPSERLVVQLAESLAFEAAATATVPQVIEVSQSSGSPLAGDGSLGFLPSSWMLAALFNTARDHDLPPSTAPPGSASTDAYKARAPLID